MIYSTIEIGKLVVLRQGFAINKKTRHHISDVPTDLALLRIADMKESTQCVYLKDTIPVQFIAKKEDIIYTRTGQVGLVFKNQKGVIHNNCFTVSPRDINVLDKNYLYYALLNQDFYTKANNLASGAAQLDLSHGSFNSISIYLPPIENQKKIADILSAYDDLIENNQKQIKLLEESAQRLYKEWFVDLRFPGHETTQIIDALPEGWCRKTVVDIGEFKRGKTITKKQVKEGIVPVVAGGVQPAYYHNISNTNEPVITISASGNAGFVNLYHQKIWASDCSYLDNQMTDSIFYIYCFLKYNQENIYAMQKGTCQQHVHAKDINDMEIIIPSQQVLSLFESVVCNDQNKIKILKEQNRLLKEARDRLLPKLMSGEIEV